jgi:hypothetical protein
LVTALANSSNHFSGNRVNQALGKELKFSSAIWTKIDLNRVVCDWNFSVSPVFKNKAGAPLINYPKKTQALFLIGLRNEVFEVGTTDSKTHFTGPSFLSQPRVCGQSNSTIRHLSGYRVYQELSYVEWV